MLINNDRNIMFVVGIVKRFKFHYLAAFDNVC